MGGSDESSIKYELSQTAYIKLVLHALNHPSSAVNGVLLGRLGPDNTGTVRISDAMPLSHSASAALLPPLEIALTQADEYYWKEGELSVVGYYHANERHDDCELSSTARKIGDHIFRYFPQAAVLLLDNKKLDQLIKGNGRDPAVTLFTRDSSKAWRQVGSERRNQSVLKEPSAHALLADFIASKKWTQIVDFEDHLDDITNCNIGEGGICLAEAVHGSAPDIAGKNLANPTALLLSAVMMLRHLNLNSHADQIHGAILKTIAEGKYCTADLGGTSSTTDFTQALCDNL